MRKNACFVRIVATILTAALLLGMLPMTAMRVFAEDVADNALGEWVQVVSSEQVTVYERISSFADLKADHDNTNISEETLSKPIYLGFGENNFYALTHSGANLSVKNTQVATSAEFPGYYTITNADALSKWYYQQYVQGNTNSQAGGFSTSYMPFDWTGNKVDPEGDNKDVTYNYEGYFVIPNTGWNGDLSLHNNPWAALYIAEGSNGVMTWTATTANSYTGESEEVTNNTALPNGTKVTIGIKEGTLYSYKEEEVNAEGFDTDAVSFFIYAPVEQTTEGVYAALDAEDYEIQVGYEGGADMLAKNILSDSRIYVNNAQSLEGATHFALSEAPEGYTVSTAWDKTLDTNTAGTYVMTVSLTETTTNATKDIGTIQVTVVDNSVTETTSATEATTAPEVTTPTEGTQELTMTVDPTALEMSKGETKTIHISIANIGSLTNYGVELKEYGDIISVSNAHNPDDRDYVSGLTEIDFTVKAEKVGSKNIQVILWDSAWKALITISVPVTVTDPSASEYAISLSTPVMHIGQSGQIAATVTRNGEQITDNFPQITWTSSDSAVVSIAKTDADAWNTATVTSGTAYGDVTITATLPDGSFATTVVSVVPVFTMTLEESIQVEAGGTYTLVPQIYADGSPLPEGSTVDLSWGSQNEAVATVSNGVVTGIAAGDSTKVYAFLNGVTMGGKEYKLEGTSAIVGTVVVNVTAPTPKVTLDTAGLAANITLDKQIEDKKTATVTLTPVGQNLPEGVTLGEVTYEVTTDNSFVTAAVSGNELTLSAVEKTAAPVSVTVTITGAKGSDGNDIAVSETDKSFTFQVTVTDDLSATPVVTLEKSNLFLVCGTEGSAVGVASVMHGSTEITEYSVSYAVTSGNGITLDGTTVKAADEESSGNEVTVTVTYTIGGQEKTATATFTVDVIDLVSDYTIDIGADFVAKSDEKGLTGNAIPAGTTFTVVPNVGVKDWLDSYTIQWSLKNASPAGTEVVNISNTTTNGGVLPADADGIQRIGNGGVSINTSNPGTVTLVATLVDVNGEPVYGISDEIDITVVQASDAQKIDESVMYNRNQKLYGRDGVKDEKTLEYSYPGSQDVYEFRIKDAHTFLPEGYELEDDLEGVTYIPGGYGLDARILAVVGDRRIDFSQVTLNLYKNGELVLNNTTGLPVEIPASELSFYDVDTDKVGWVRVRVTYKDYYLGYIASGRSDFYLYDEYTTGMNGTDGYVWMYVREPYEVQQSAQGMVYDQTKKTYPLYTANELTSGKYVIVGYVSDSYKAIIQNYNLEPSGEITIADDMVTFTADNLVWTVEKLDDYYVIRTAASGQYVCAGSNSAVGCTSDVSNALRFTATPGANGGHTLQVVGNDGQLTGQYLACGRLGNEYYSYDATYLSNDPAAAVYLYKEYRPSAPASVLINVSNVRSWMGEGTKLSVENQTWYPLKKETRDAMEGVDGFKWTEVFNYFSVDMTVEYQGEQYTFTQRDGNKELKPLWRWKTSGALEAVDTGKSDDTVHHVTEITAKDLNGASALGMLQLELYSVYIPSIDKTVELENPVSLDIPIGVREDSTGKDVNQVTFGYSPSWGGLDGFAYESFLGGVNISSYAISYETDLAPEMYEIGLEDVPAPKVGSSSWYEFFAVNAPMGTTTVDSHFHSYTLDTGIVMILEPAEREGEAAPYTIELDPQMLILHARNGEIVDTGTVSATIRNMDGTLIDENVPVVVQWTMRNTTYATADVITATGRDAASPSMSHTGPHITGKDAVTITGEAPGVTFITVQLLQVDGVSVADQYIADYSIIYVIDSDTTDSKEFVIDYGKAVNIDISKMISDELGTNGTGFELIGFTDLADPLRLHALTNYGEIEATKDGTTVTSVVYTPGEMLNGVDRIYAIFQRKTESNGTTNYEWHHHLIHIIPATVMYYEVESNLYDNFTFTGTWTHVAPDSVGVQDDYAVGGIYGYDSHYNGNDEFSDGGYVLAKGEGVNDTQVKFTFTGTGFDIISKTDKNQTMIRVWVYSGTEATGTATRTVSVMNKGENNLCQLPVVSVDDLPFGTYTVVIGVFPGYDPDQYPIPDSLKETLRRGDQFYFDAVRIYNPVEADTVISSGLTVADQYKTDGEYKPTISEVGQILIDAKAEEALVDGVIFLDDADRILKELENGKLEGDGDDSTGDISQGGIYDTYGANNEVYLAAGEGIAFALSANGKTPASVDIGAKSITGASVTLTAWIYASPESNSTTYSMVQKTIESNTQQYFSLMENPVGGATLTSLFANDNKAYVVIQNTGKDEGWLSITDIKVAYNDDPEAAVTFLADRSVMLFAARRMTAPAVIPEPLNGMQKDENGRWYYYVDGVVDTSYTGLVDNHVGTWYVQNGEIILNYDGAVEVDGEIYYIKAGMVSKATTGVFKYSGEWLYYAEGKVDRSFTGVCGNFCGLWYVENGAINFNKSGLVEHEGKLLYFRYGQHYLNFEGLVKADNGDWLYVNNGYVDYAFVGLAKNHVGWWYVKNGTIDFTYNGTATNFVGTFNVVNGQVDASQTVD